MSTRSNGIDRRRARGAASCVAVLAAVSVACASAEVYNPRSLAYYDQTLKKPDRVVVHNFAVTEAEVNLNRSFIAEAMRDDETGEANDERQEIGHAAATVVAATVVANLRDRGLVAERASDIGAGSITGTDLSIEGQFLDVDAGNRMSRTVVGFGMGATELDSVVQVYSLEGGERRLLGDFNVKAEGGKKPGLVLGAGVGAVTGAWAGAVAMAGVGAAMEVLGPLSGNAKDTGEQIAELLLERYERRGWISKQ